MALLVIFFALGYFSPRNGKKYSPIRNTLFLDADRVLQKKLAPLKKGSGLEGLDEILVIYKAHLDLGCLSVIFKSEGKSEFFSKALGHPANGGDEAVDVELVLRSSTSNGTGQIRANLNPSKQYELDRVRYWLNVLPNEVTSSMELELEQSHAKM